MADEINRSGWPVMCAECGEPFMVGDEYLVVQRVKLKQSSYLANLVEVVGETTLCLTCANGGEEE